MTQLHEDLSRKESLEAKTGTDRSFGLVFATVFALIGCYPVLYGVAPRWWLVGLALATLAVAIASPVVFRLPNRWWMRLGHVLALVVGPVAIGIVYYGAIVPMGLLIRLVGKDPLRLRPDRQSDSYWIPRTPPGPDPKSLRDQF